ncbi:unnamed protein product [Closterium sp. NIES-65]|nr:unnamed protein product [Closterium sp. NIES-65]
MGARRIGGEGCGGPRKRSECHHKGDGGEEMGGGGVLWSSLHLDGLCCPRCPFCVLFPCLSKLQQISNHLELLKPNPRDPPDKQARDLAFARLALAGDADLAGGVREASDLLTLGSSEHCGKLRALDRLLNQWCGSGDKVLLFSHSVKMLDVLQRFLEARGISFSRLDGSTSTATRQALVHGFNSSPSIQVFLISTKAGGIGLNLVSANRVIILDPTWNPAHDLQAQDRSFRFGQTRHVSVYRLVAGGTVEEVVYLRQVYKQQQTNIAIEGASEQRYFTGVQGFKSHQGELFGVANLFQDRSTSILSAEIIGKAARQPQRQQQQEKQQEEQGREDEKEVNVDRKRQEEVEKRRNKSSEAPSVMREKPHCDSQKDEDDLLVVQVPDGGIAPETPGESPESPGISPEAPGEHRLEGNPGFASAERGEGLGLASKREELMVKAGRVKGRKEDEEDNGVSGLARLVEAREVPGLWTQKGRGKGRVKCERRKGRKEGREGEEGLEGRGDRDGEEEEEDEIEDTGGESDGVKGHQGGQEGMSGHAHGMGHDAHGMGHDGHDAHGMGHDAHGMGHDAHGMGHDAHGMGHDVHGIGHDDYGMGSIPDELLDAGVAYTHVNDDVIRGHHGSRTVTPLAAAFLDDHSTTEPRPLSRPPPASVKPSTLSRSIKERVQTAGSVKRKRSGARTGVGGKCGVVAEGVGGRKRKGDAHKEQQKKTDSRKRSREGGEEASARRHPPRQLLKQRVETVEKFEGQETAESSAEDMELPIGSGGGIEERSGMAAQENDIVSDFLLESRMSRGIGNDGGLSQLPPGAAAALRGALRWAPPAPKNDEPKRLKINLDLDIYRARNLFRIGKAQDAEGLMRKAVRDWPDDGRPYVVLGRMLQRKGRLGEARGVFEDGCQALGGDNAFIWQTWAVLEAQAGNVEKARKLFDAATVADERHVAAWHGWAVLELKQGNVRRARELLQKGLKLCGGNEYIYQTLAVMEVQSGRVAEARALFLQATRMNAKSAASWLAWALLEAQQGDGASARLLFQRSLNASPKNPYTWQAWGLFEAAQGRYDRGRLLLQRGAQLNPKDAALLQALALLEYECGFTGTARELFSQASLVDPNHQPVWTVSGVRCRRVLRRHRDGWSGRRNESCTSFNPPLPSSPASFNPPLPSSPASFNPPLPSSPASFNPPLPSSPASFNPPLPSSPASFNPPLPSSPASFNPPLPSSPASFNPPLPSSPASFNPPLPSSPASFNPPLPSSPASFNPPLPSSPASFFRIPSPPPDPPCRSTRHGGGWSGRRGGCSEQGSSTREQWREMTPRPTLPECSSMPAHHLYCTSPSCSHPPPIPSTPQAWAVLEEREGNIGLARALFKRALAADSGNSVVWRSWAAMEERQGNAVRAEELRLMRLQQRTEVVEPTSWDLGGIIGPAIDRMKALFSPTRPMPFSSSRADVSSSSSSSNSGSSGDSSSREGASSSGAAAGEAEGGSAALLDEYGDEVEEFDVDGFLAARLPKQFSKLLDDVDGVGKSIWRKPVSVEGMRQRRFTGEFEKEADPGVREAT